MADLELDITNEGHNGTEIQAQTDFGSNDYVFQANATTAGGDRDIDGLHGLGLNEGTGVVGVGGTGVVSSSGRTPGGAGVKGEGGGRGPGVKGIGGSDAGSGIEGIGGGPRALQGIGRRFAGIGVLGQGGSKKLPGDHAGAGVVGLAGGAKQPKDEVLRSVGVLGVGAVAEIPPFPPTPQGVAIGGTGVLGLGGDRQRFGDQWGAGVVGIAGSQGTPHVSETQNIGVFGSSNQDGMGVVGITGSTKVTSLPDTGVLGLSGAGTGVFGKSDEGPGVFGQSTQGRGGVFGCSKTVAQVRLVPVEQANRVPVLPAKGKVGDLLLVRNIIRVQDDVLTDSCSLWLCIPKDSTDNSDRWQEVALGQQVVKGTL